MRDLSESDNKRILIVDPDVGTINLLRLMLSEYDCICANNGETAVKLYSKFKPDLVLTEITLPETNGVEIAKKILEIDPEAKIIGLTAFKHRWGNALLEAGAVDIIEKPFRKKELLDIVKKHLK